MISIWICIFLVSINVWWIGIRFCRRLEKLEKKQREMSKKMICLSSIRI